MAESVGSFFAVDASNHKYKMLMSADAIYSQPDLATGVRNLAGYGPVTLSTQDAKEVKFVSKGVYEIEFYDGRLIQVTSDDSIAP